GQAVGVLLRGGYDSQRGEQPALDDIQMVVLDDKCPLLGRIDPRLFFRRNLMRLGSRLFRSDRDSLASSWRGGLRNVGNNRQAAMQRSRAGRQRIADARHGVEQTQRRSARVT